MQVMTSDVTPIVLFWVLLLVTLLAGTVSGTIRVVDDDWAGADFQTIGAAVNASSDGDLILVYAGVYGEHVRVNVLVEIVGNGSALTVVDGGGTGTVFEVDADGVRISGLRITGSGSQWSDAGVAISGDDDLTVDNCTFDGHLNAGVLVTQADGCSVVDSTFTECTTHGIQIRSATSTRMANLTFEGGAIFISGSSRDEYVTHTVENCTVDGRPLFFAVGGEAVVVPQDSGAVIVIDCEHVLVRGLTLTGSNVGVLAAYSDSVIVEDTVIEDQRYGIQTWQSTNTSIDNCTILNCTIFGIDLSPGSDRTEIADTTVRDCRYGVRALSADDLRIRRSAIGPCTSYGLFLDSDSDRPRIEDTTTDGCQIGIFGKWWSGGRLKNCTVRDSTGVGIDLTEVGGLLVMGCHIANNTGGGLRSTNSTISVEDTVVTANGGTGVVLWGNDSVIDGGVVSDNGADGAVLSGRGCAARNTTFEGNDGSGVMMTGDGHEVWRCTVRSNGRGIVLRSYTTNCSA
ncbi:MAG TPA: hypothetical protein EYP43_02595, partial [Thermoplasmata archaeon]|nr:hypothetical protein [Thermoplasmata archaeon]